MGELFDLDRLDDTDPFEIDRQVAHLFKHDPYGIDDPTKCRPIGCYLAAKHLADRYKEDR